MHVWGLGGRACACWHVPSFSSAACMRPWLRPPCCAALRALGLMTTLNTQPDYSPQGERNRNMVVAQAPFSSERKRMTTAVFNQAFK